MDTLRIEQGVLDVELFMSLLHVPEHVRDFDALKAVADEELKAQRNRAHATDLELPDPHVVGSCEGQVIRVNELKTLRSLKEYTREHSLVGFESERTDWKHRYIAVEVQDLSLVRHSCLIRFELNALKQLTSNVKVSTPGCAVFSSLDELLTDYATNLVEWFRDKGALGMSDPPQPPDEIAF
jgi:hypothetical protein